MASLLRRHLDPVGHSSSFRAGEDRDGVPLTAVGQDTELACRDDPYPRRLCAVFPFTQCQCYACEVPAPGFSWFDHCHATEKDDHSMILRSSVEQNIMAPPDLILPESELISTGPLSAFSRLAVADQIHPRGSSITRINQVCKKRRSNLRSQAKRVPTDGLTDDLAAQIMSYSRRYKRRALTPMFKINMKQPGSALSRNRQRSVIDWKQWRALVAEGTCETDTDDSYQPLSKRFRLMDLSPRHSNSRADLETDTDENYHRLIRRFRLMELSARRSTSEETVDIDGKHSKSILQY